MKGESESKDVMVAKCPLPFSIWMISLSWHNPLKICLFSIPAQEISHSTHQFLSLHSNQVIVLVLKGEHTELSQWNPSPGLSNWTTTWPTWGLIIQLIWFHVLYMQPLSSMHEQMPPLFLISFAHHQKARLSTGLHGALATLRELSSKASWGNAPASATYSRVLGQTLEQTVMWFAYINGRLSTH